MASAQFSMRCRVLVGTILVVLVFLIFQADGALHLAQAQVAEPAVFVSEPVMPHVLDIDLRTIPPQKPWQPGDPVAEVSIIKAPMPGGVLPLTSAPGAEIDGAIQTESYIGAEITPVEFSTPSPNFDGIAFTGFTPPDTIGDVGRHHYIQMVNAQFVIFDKRGNLLAGPFDINELWAMAGDDQAACRDRNRGDPYVLYDHLADRWLISQFTGIAGQTEFHQCIAISRTNDPVSGGFFTYDFRIRDAAGNDIVNDYPKIAVWPDGYYMSTQRGFPGAGLDVYAFDRANMLNFNPATFQSFFVAAPSLVLLPSDLDGPPPPPGTPNFFVRHRDFGLWGGCAGVGADCIEMFAFSVNFANPALSSFTALPALPTVAFDSGLCAPGTLNDTCVPQPGAVVPTLDTIPNWPMGPLQYRTFHIHDQTHEALVFNHTVDADGTGHAGIRWYELRRPLGGAWSIFQQGTFSPDGGAPGLADDPHRWMGSIAMDEAGNIALGYSASSSTLFPSVRYAGRLADDPLGTLPHGEFTMVAGAGSQTASTRWGDYSGMRVDPVDGCTFWYTQQYIRADGRWNTRIAAFGFPSCNPADLSIDMTDNPDPVGVGGELTYRLRVRNLGPSNATGVILTDTLPANVNFVSASSGCSRSGSTVTCEIGDMSDGESDVRLIRVRSTTSGGVSNTATVRANETDPDPANNTVTTVTTVR